MTASQVSNFQITPADYGAQYALLANTAGWPTPGAYFNSYAAAVREGDIVPPAGWNVAAIMEAAVPWVPILIGGVILWYLLKRN